MITPRSLGHLVLVLSFAGLWACEAPEVYPRQPQLVRGSDPREASGPGATLLRQVEAVKEKLGQGSKPVGILVALGNLYYENGRYPEAIDWYRQAIEAARPALEAYRALGEGPRGEAPKACETRADASSFEKAVARAKALAASGDARRARACYARALRLVAGAMARRGSAWAVLDQPERGVAELDQALVLTPDDPEALFYYGAVVFNARKDDPNLDVHRAVERWKRFLELVPDHPRAAQVRSALETLEGELAPAPGATSPEPPAAVQAGLPPALAQASRLLWAKSWQAALDLCERFLQVAPTHGTALALKAQALLGLGQPEAAKEVAEAALEVGPNVRAEEVLARYYETVAKDPAAAQAHYQAMQKIDPAYAAAVGVGGAKAP